MHYLTILLLDTDRTTIVDELTPFFDPDSIQFSTELDGGFGQFAGVMKRNNVYAWHALQAHAFYRVLVQDHRHETVFDGRISGMDLAKTGAGENRLVADGWQCACRDEVYSNSDGGEWTVTEAFEDILNTACPSLTYANRSIATNDLLVKKETRNEVYPAELFSRLARLGNPSYTTPPYRAWYWWAVYEDLGLQYFAVQPEQTAVDWRADPSIIPPDGFKARVNYGEIKNKVRGHFTGHFTPDVCYYYDASAAPPGEVAMANATDDDTSTYVQLGSFQSDDRLFVGHASQFNSIHIKLVDGYGNANAVTIDSIRYSYDVSHQFQDASWSSETADGTESGGATLAQNGAITFSAPADEWVQSTGGPGSDTKYWIEIGFSGALSADVRIAEIDVKAGGTNATDWTEDADSQSQFGYTREHVLTLGDMDEEASLRALDAYLEEHNALRFSTIAVELGRYVWEAELPVLVPSWSIRAGDLINLNPLFPPSVGADFGLNKLIIQATSWRAGKMSIVPNLDPDLVALIVEQGTL